MRLTHTSPSSAEFMNEWSRTSAPPLCLLGIDRDYFLFHVLCTVFALICLNCVLFQRRVTHLRRRNWVKKLGKQLQKKAVGCLVQMTGNATSEFNNFCMLLMKRWFVVTHRCWIVQETEKLDRSLIDKHWSVLWFYKNIRRNNFLWTQHFDRRCVFTLLSSSAGISAWQIVCVTIYFYLMSSVSCTHSTFNLLLHDQHHTFVVNTTAYVWWLAGVFLIVEVTIPSQDFVLFVSLCREIL
jgi:hypothetical protein